MAFRRGPEINPFAGSSQEPLLILQDVSPLELAAAVPFIKITKIDYRTGVASTDVRPLMFDLTEAPEFAQFGSDSDTFLERSAVSLNSMTVKSQHPNGDIMFREVALKFTVHRPETVFDRGSRIAWREILEEGNSFSLEYGWSADPTACKNPLFNGYGYVTQGGVLVSSKRVTLMHVYRWTVNLKADGSVDVTVDAMENGDLALRDARFSDAFERTFEKDDVVTRLGLIPQVVGPLRGNDKSNASRMKSLLDKLDTIDIKKYGKMILFGDVLDNILAPMIEVVMQQHGGYTAGKPVELLLGNFNLRAGSQSAKYGGRTPESIGDFMLPLDVLREILSKDFSLGRAMTLQSFTRILISIVNSVDGWSDNVDKIKAMIGLKLSTVETDSGFQLVLSIFDRRTVADTISGLSFLKLDSQSKDDVRKALANADVPLIEFAKANSVIIDASFEMQPNSLLQSIQIENASGGRKSRIQMTGMPDVESRRGQALPKEIVPISVLEGDLTMIGNFVFDPPSRIWLDFFGSRAISGIFNVMEQVDTLEPGKFTTQLHVISEGTDPLNTRFRFTEQEISDKREEVEKTKNAARARKKK